MPKQLCIETNCTKNARDSSYKCSVHGGGPRCIEPGCISGATTGKTKKCIIHGGGKRCEEPQCIKGAIGKNNKCKAHGGGNRCKEYGCKKSAKGGYSKCVEHGGGNRCTEPGCKTSARIKNDKCIVHGGGPRCIESGCINGAIGKNNKCKMHGGGKRCIKSGCNKSAKGSTDMCIAHGGGLRCTEPGCIKSSQSNSKCVEHGGGIRCPNCITWTDSRCGWKKYDGYCATCFKQIFPNDERSKVVYIHTKEMRVRNKINETFEEFIHDKPLYTSECNCTHRRRIDHRKLIGSTLLCVETDEFGHAGYDLKDEEIRYDDLYMIHSGKWIFIRFNPDGKGVDMEDKLNKLIEIMNEQIKRIEQDKNKELVEIIKLFY